MDGVDPSDGKQGFHVRIINQKSRRVEKEQDYTERVLLETLVNHLQGKRGNGRGTKGRVTM